MKKLLIVVDMQNDFIDGSLGTSEAQAIVPNVIAKIKETELNGGRVVFTRDTHYNDYLKTQEGKNLPVEHCIKYTNGWQITDSVIESSNSISLDKKHFIFDKPTFGSIDLGNSMLGNSIRNCGFNEVELVGLDLDICVISNALLIKAFCPEVKVSVDVSCCAATTKEKFKASILILKSCQVDILNEQS